MPIKASASYNVQFVHFNSDASAFSSGCEAFAQIILTPGTTDFFRLGGIEAFDTFIVRNIEWNYVPPATEAEIGDYEDSDDINKQAYFPYSNSIIRFAYDATADISTLSDVEKDMDRYMKIEDAANSTIVQDMAKKAIKGNKYYTQSSMDPKEGMILRPSAMTFNSAGPVSNVRTRTRMSTNNIWKLNPNGKPPSEVNNAGKIAATYGTLSFIIPVFLGGFKKLDGTVMERKDLKWPVEQAFVNVTFNLMCYGSA